MTLIRVSIATLLVAIVASAAPAVAAAEDGATPTPYNICQHLPWWPGCV